MKLSKIVPSALLMGTLALTSACKKAQSETANHVTDTLSKDPIELLVRKYPNIHDLLELVNNSDKTAEYFHEAEKAYLKAGMDPSIAGPRADMKARLMTLADLINAGDITAKQLEDILRSGVLSYSLPVKLQYPVDKIDAFLKDFGDDATSASLHGVHGDTLVLTRPGKGLEFLIEIQ